MRRSSRAWRTAATDPPDSVTSALRAEQEATAGRIAESPLARLARDSATANKGFRVILASQLPIHKNVAPDRGWYVKPEDGPAAFYQVSERHAARAPATFPGPFHNGIRGGRDRGKLVEVLCTSGYDNRDRLLAANECVRAENRRTISRPGRLKPQAASLLRARA